jgi:hypothetical protein
MSLLLRACVYYSNRGEERRDVFFFLHYHFLFWMHLPFWDRIGGGEKKGMASYLSKTWSATPGSIGEEF